MTPRPCSSSGSCGGGAGEEKRTGWRRLGGGHLLCYVLPEAVEDLLGHGLADAVLSTEANENHPDMQTLQIEAGALVVFDSCPIGY